MQRRPETPTDFVRLEPEPETTRDPLDPLALPTEPLAQDSPEAMDTAMDVAAPVPEVIAVVPTEAPRIPYPGREASLVPTKVVLDFSRKIGPRSGRARAQALADNRGTPETEAAVLRALRWLQRVDCRWAQPWADNALYHWYYVTQAKFHAGGSLWNDWNAAFSPELTQHQRVEPAAVLDATGALVDIGYWESPNGKSYCDSRVYNTTLCTLMLEVYYRQIATYRQPAEAPDAPTGLGGSPDDYTVQVL